MLPTVCSLWLQPFCTRRGPGIPTGTGQIGGNDNNGELDQMKTTRIITAAAGLVMAAGLIGTLATPALAGTTPVAAHQLKGTLSIRPGSLSLAASASQLEVIDATGSGRGWRVVIGGDAQVTSFQCAPDSTCILPAPGVTGNVITADPGTGMGAVIFNWTVSGTITVDLTSGP
jgi:hypothetical protein